MDGWIIIKTIIDNKEFNLNYKKLRTQIKRMGKGIETFLKNSFKNGLSAAKGILSIIATITKSILKIGLATIGITTGIGLLIAGALILSKAFERVFKENEQIKANLDYMKFAIIKALEPAINIVADVLVKIINFLAKIMQYTAYIIKAWTGYNIFEKATPEAYAEYFEKAQKNSKKTAKNAKEIKKQLAGFDEMNILQDTSSSSENEGSGFVAPSINFSELPNEKTPEWLEKIVEIGKWILDNWEDVVFTLLLFKLFIDLLTGNWIGVVIDLIGLLIVGFIKIWDSIKAIWESIKKLWGIFVEWITAKWNDFTKWFGEKIEGLKEKWEEFKEKIKEIWNLIINWVKEKWNNFIDWINNKINSIGDFFKNLWQGVKDGVKSAVDWIKEKFNSIVDFFSNIVSKITNFFKDIGTKAGDVIGSAFKTVINGVLNAIENILNFPIKSINKLINVINKVPGINLDKLSTFNLPRLAKGGIVNMPGRGINYGGANIAERGAEGIIPLTDSQQMALLGEAIGKYITINANITNSMNGRVISRELKRIQNQDDFAMNR